VIEWEMDGNEKIKNKIVDQQKYFSKCGFDCFHTLIAMA
jgi:hypothetical protein